MQNENIHGLHGTILSIFLIVLGKGFHYLIYLNAPVAGEPMHIFLSNVSMSVGILVGIVTLINNAQRLVNNVKMFFSLIKNKFK